MGKHLFWILIFVIGGLKTPKAEAGCWLSLFRWTVLDPRDFDHEIARVRQSEEQLLKSFGALFQEGFQTEGIAYASKLSTPLRRFSRYSEKLGALMKSGRGTMTTQQWEILAESIRNVENRFLRVLEFMIWENLGSRRMPTPNNFSLYAGGNILADSDSILQPPNYKLVLNFYHEILNLKRDIADSRLGVQQIAAGLRPQYVRTVNAGIHITRIYDERSRLSQLPPQTWDWIASFLRKKPSMSTAQLLKMESGLVRSWQSKVDRNAPEFIQYARNVWGILGDTIDYVDELEELFLVGKISDDPVRKSQARSSLERLEKEFLRPMNSHLRSVAVSRHLRTRNGFLVYAVGNIFADDGIAFQTPLFKRVFYFQGALNRLRELREEFLPEDSTLLEGLRPDFTKTYDQCIHLSSLYRR
jgi:hypothetical protein